MMKISPLIRKELERIIRIDHAGELGAKIIYNAQIKFTKDENQSTILRRMLLQELEHLDYFLETLADKEPPGRKLAFVTQEIGREINTLGSKANDADIQKLVVQMKDELEKIKEQSMNVL